jgi:hypothetical protein
MEPENADGKQASRTGGRFQKGVSGNPRGKPPGARHATTIMAEQLMEGEAEAVVRAVVAKAKQGDMRAARLVRGSANGVAAAQTTDAAVVPMPSVADEDCVHLHPRCWPAWCRRRRADALAALRSFGIPVPVAARTERDTAAGRQSGIVFS